MMKSIFSFVATAMLMTGCVGSDEVAPSPDVTESAAEIQSESASLSEIDLADVEANAHQAYYCRSGYYCCESELNMGYDDGDEHPDECWICRRRGTPCP